MSYAPFPLVWGFFGSGGGGGGGPAFGVIQTDFGTYPTASGTSDVLTLVSADNTRYYFTGTALTDTITLTVNGLIPPGGNYGQILAKSSGTNFDVEWRDGVQVTSVYNNSGSTIAKGSIVYINGASGNLPTIALSQANTEATSTKTYGFVVSDISNMSSGSVVASGQIRNLDTFGVTEGVTLWLSPSTAGAYTTTKPTAPNHAVVVGVCTRAHPSQGTIEVKIQNGYELEELHNVSISSPSNGQVLSYDSSTSLWKNTTLSGTGSVTSVSVVTANGLAGTVANASTTPAITLSTTVTGLLKGNGTSISAATAGTDYQSPITTGNLTESTSSVLTISGGSSAVIGSGTSIQVKQASTSQSGYLSSTDWNTFNGKQAAITGAATTITTTDLTASKVLISNSLGKVAVSSVSDTTLGYLDATSSIQTQLNGKEPTLTKGNLSESTSSVLTISGGTGSVIGSGTSIQVKQSGSGQSGYLSSTDWSTFNGKPNLTSTAAQSITTTNAAGSATDAARSDHTHKGVSSVAKNGSTALYGDVTLSAGSNVTLTQVGNDISIAATGGGGGSGTVTDVSVVSANGFAGTVANSTTTPAITLTTSVTGVLKGNGTAISAATAGTDYEAPITGAASTITTSNLTASKALMSDGSGKVATATTTSTEIGYVAGVTSAIQTQLNAKEPTLTKGNLTESGSSILSITNGAGAVIGLGTTIQVSQAGGFTSGYLSNSDWITFNTKQDPITGGATTITTSNLTASRALASDGSGKVAISATTSTELGYVSGVTSAIQTQINGKEPTLTKGNLTEATSSVLTITGGTNAVIGSGTSIQVKAADTTQAGTISALEYRGLTYKVLPSDLDYSTYVRFGSSSINNMNNQSNSVSGSQSAITALATSAVIHKIPHINNTTVSTAGSNCGYRIGGTVTYTLPFIAGGFKFSHVFQINDASTLALARTFVGFNTSSAAIAINTSTNTDPFRATFTNFFGIGHDSYFGDTNLKLFYNAGTAGSTTVVDLGSGFSIASGADTYIVNFYNATNSTDVYYEIYGYISGNRASGVMTSNLPTAVGLYAHTTRSNGGSTGVATYKTGGMKLFVGC